MGRVEKYRSMRGKILILCLMSTLVALLLQTVLFIRVSDNLIYGWTKDESYNLLNNMQNEITTFVKRIESNMIAVYNEKQFVQALKEDNSDGHLQKDYYKMAYNLATTRFDTSDKVVAVYIYRIDHEIISTYRRAVTPKHNYPKDIYEQEEQNNAGKVREYIESDEKSTLISSYYNPYREKNIVRICLKIYDTVSSKDKLGYIICDVDSSAFVKIMEKYSSHLQGYMWLQPEGDRVLVHSGALTEDNREFYEAVTEKIQNGTGEFDVYRKNKVLFQVPQEKYNILACSIVPQHILHQNQHALTQNLILIVLVMSALITLVTVFVTKTLTRPLEQLTTTVRKIKSGDTKKRVSYLKKDEIGELGLEFNQMLDRIETLIGQEYETKLLLNKAEYKALQAQINPHFLYNTLDTMSSIAEIQNCNMVSNLCQSLSSIFRYSLSMKTPYATVSQEIVHLKNYIYVMNVRMRDEITYRFEIDESVLQNSIPRISIQPLVENSIQHGLRNKRGDKKILIKVCRENEILQVIVEDNGVGMDAESMNERLRQNDTRAMEEGTSVGLFNIHARMKMLYGTQFGLTIESDGKTGTIVRLRLPCMRMEELGNDKEGV
ncbi:MAG: HAMP domain-containing protein [Lachnospiraceae bacterium]|nr:HAMP domain-containing protein [Lachnospiraceae bacterium]